MYHFKMSSPQKHWFDIVMKRFFIENNSTVRGHNKIIVKYNSVKNQQLKRLSYLLQDRDC